MEKSIQKIILLLGVAMCISAINVNAKSHKMPKRYSTEYLSGNYKIQKEPKYKAPKKYKDDVERAIAITGQKIKILRYKISRKHCYVKISMVNYPRINGWVNYKDLENHRQYKKGHTILQKQINEMKRAQNQKGKLTNRFENEIHAGKTEKKFMKLYQIK